MGTSVRAVRLQLSGQMRQIPWAARGWNPVPAASRFGKELNNLVSFFPIVLAGVTGTGFPTVSTKGNNPKLVLDRSPRSKCWGLSTTRCADNFPVWGGLVSVMGC